MRCSIESLETRVLLATFLVTNTNDAGAGSLRQAILDANNTPGLDEIHFAIGSGVQTITPLSALPEIEDPVIIDGSTQPGFAGTPIIELNGSQAGGGANGLRVREGGSTIRSLVINRFGSDGIDLSRRPGNTVVGCYIGTDVTGTVARPNLDSGIDVGDDFNTIRDNLISGNQFEGILLQDDNNLSGNVIVNNRIGTDVTGTMPIPNRGPGVRIINGINNRIGGVNAADANIIAFNLGDGVEVQSGIDNAILGNSIFLNQGLGIDLLPNGVTPNDPGDLDTGPNGLQNFPVLASAANTATNTVVSGMLDSTPNRSFRVEFFANDVLDPSGHGEGRTFLGFTNVFTSANGIAQFSQVPLALAPAGHWVTATATTQGGSTSEFSAGQRIPAELIPPAVSSSAFHFDGTILPDPPHRLQYSFTKDVSASLGTDDLVLQNLTAGTTVSTAAIALSYDLATNTATFTFPGLAGGVLPDGNYSARLVAAGITDADGTMLDGNGDGSPGGDHLHDFFFLAADFNHDGIVNLADFNILAANFGQSPRFFSQGDANYDGVVNLSDFNILAGRFGVVLAPAAGTSSLSFGGGDDAKSDDESLFGATRIDGGEASLV